MKSKEIGYVALGVYGAVVAFAAYKWVDNRLSQVERAARSFPTVEPPKSLDDMRRESAREFIALLREEGLVVAEAKS
jgi:hypothetical protein